MNLVALSTYTIDIFLFFSCFVSSVVALMTYAVDWALKSNYLSSAVWLSLHMRIAVL